MCLDKGEKMQKEWAKGLKEKESTQSSEKVLKISNNICIYIQRNKYISIYNELRNKYVRII